MTTDLAFSRMVATSPAESDWTGRAWAAAAPPLGLHDLRADAAEEHVGERAVHGLAHDEREDESRRAVEGARDDEELVVEDEAQRRR